MVKTRVTRLRGVEGRNACDQVRFFGLIHYSTRRNGRTVVEFAIETKALMTFNKVFVSKRMIC